MCGKGKRNRMKTGGKGNKKEIEGKKKNDELWKVESLGSKGEKRV